MNGACSNRHRMSIIIMLSSSLLPSSLTMHSVNSKQVVSQTLFYQIRRIIQHFEKENVNTAQQCVYNIHHRRQYTLNLRLRGTQKRIAKRKRNQCLFHKLYIPLYLYRMPECKYSATRNHINSIICVVGRELKNMYNKYTHCIRCIWYVR